MKFGDEQKFWFWLFIAICLLIFALLFVFALDNAHANDYSFPEHQTTGQQMYIYEGDSYNYNNYLDEQQVLERQYEIRNPEVAYPLPTSDWDRPIPDPADNTPWDLKE